MPKAKTSEKNKPQTLTASDNKTASAKKPACATPASPKRSGTLVGAAAPKSLAPSLRTSEKSSSAKPIAQKSLAAVRAAKASIDSVRASKRAAAAATERKTSTSSAVQSPSESPSSLSALPIIQLAESQPPSDSSNAASSLVAETATIASAATVSPDKIVLAADAQTQPECTVTLSADFPTAQDVLPPACARLDLDQAPVDTAEETLATLVDPESFSLKPDRAVAFSPFTLSPSDISRGSNASQDCQALSAAINKADAQALAALLESNPSLARRTDAIFQAAGTGRADLVQLLLDAGADPDHLAEGSRPLHRAIEAAAGRSANTSNGTTAYLDVIRALLLGGADVRARASQFQVTPIALCAMLGQELFIRDLLGYCDRWDIFTACALGRSDVVWMILSRDPSAATAIEVNSMSALHYCAASRLGSSDPAKAARLATIAQHLIASGAAVNARADATSRTPLAWAEGNAAVTEILLANGASASNAPLAASNQSAPRKSRISLPRRSHRATRAAA